MFSKIARVLWGNFESSDELKKFGFLAAIFGLIIGTYWTLRPLKDSLFNAVVGLDNQPYAKILSVLIVFPLVILYGKLIDTFPRNKVFYGLTIFYAVLALFFMWAFMHPEIGLTNSVKSTGRFIGWAWYVYVESFGSLVVALFWAFTADTTAPNSARRGFPIISMFGQIGNILGPLLLDSKRLGFATPAPVVGICGALMLGMAALFWYMMRSVAPSEWVGYTGEGAHEAKGEGKDEEPGFLEGLKLLLTQGYLMGIFLIITIYEVIVTILDYHFKATAAYQYPDVSDLNSYLNFYAIMVGVVSASCVILGINNIQRRLGMLVSLLMLPTLVIAAVIVIKFNPTWLTAALVIMVLSKAVNYALNQPVLKQLYIPTTKETKYKAQAWIEMFGSRGSKGLSSVVNSYRKTFTNKFGSLAGVDYFLTMSSVVSLALIGGWFFVAIYVAKVYNDAIKANKVVC
jgi:AAA family ATP:ADP antiporter